MATTTIQPKIERRCRTCARFIKDKRQLIARTHRCEKCGRRPASFVVMIALEFDQGGADEQH